LFNTIPLKAAWSALPADDPTVDISANIFEISSDCLALKVGL
jgi:hypothetical protein